MLVKLKFFSVPVGPDLHQLSSLWMIKKIHHVYQEIYIFELEQSFGVGIGGFYCLAVALKAGPPKEMVS